MSDVSTHPAFQQPPDTSILAWRYPDLPKLLALIIKRELYLRRLDLLPDKFEGLYPRRIYCGAGGGVAIVLPYEKLSASIDSARNQAWVGVVRYLNYDTDLFQPGNAFIPALHKRKQFEYEQEARIVDGQRARMNQRGRVLCPLNEATSTRRCDTCSTRACFSRDCRAPRHARFATFSIWRSGDSRPATFMLATRRPRSRRYAP
jgi:hypothetical protein